MVKIMQITYYCDIYISEALEKKKKKIMKKLASNSLQPFVYIITLAQGEQNHLEFYSSVLLRQHVYENTPLFVVGIADGYDGAVVLVEHIAEDVYSETGETDIREYILKRQREYEEGRV